MRIRLLHIISGLATGGAEMMLLKVLERLDQQRFAPKVISLTSLGEVGPQIAALGIPVEYVGFRPGLPNPLGLFRLVRMIKRLNPNVVHTWMYHADLLGGCAARLAGVPAIGWCIRNGSLDKGKSSFATRAVVDLCAVLSHRVPRRILSCSERARQIHVALGYAAEKMIVVPNGFDLSLFKPSEKARRDLRAELRLAEQTPLVGLMGRFNPQKNHAGFFAAAAALHQRAPQAHFVLAGRGIDQSNRELMHVIEGSGVLANTHLLGLRDQMPRLMPALDVLALSSSYGEAFPNVLGEAMACAVPCAVTDVGDSAYIIGDTGRVVECGDMAGLAIALQALLELPTSARTALGDRARARVGEMFEIGQVVKQYEAFYESLCGGAR